MEENCEDRMEWEEEMYWTHFKFIHFSQFLLPGFHHRLALPRKFSIHCKKKLPETVKLKSPSGVAYNVGLQAENGTLSFRHGWDEFVKDHSLEKNDLLVFKFDGSSHFDVLIFDGESFCEKASSYFVRKRGQIEGMTGDRGKRKAADFSNVSSRSDVEKSPTEEPLVSPTCNEHGQHISSDVQETPIEPFVISPPGNEREQGIAFVSDSRTLQNPVISPSGDGRVKEGKYTISAFQGMQRDGSNIENSDHMDIKPDIRTVSGCTERRSSSVKVFPERRAITETEKRNALSLAQAATSQDGFLVVMKRTHVTLKYFLSIPNKWLQKFMFIENQEVVLRVDQRTWNTAFHYFRNKCYGGLSSGWRKFVHDNGIYECDICVFEPTSSVSKPLLLDVYIFRASGVDIKAIADPFTTA
ncbi:PREDICTED: B3 domain-containing protein REM16-like [Tarenaya hassleriana]|uniref:B3 domain-containing protein REM16-like n=1 Tax=Tarenaya hassleriana TaxID=28532 RepID=UPI00053C68F9|nr:PREDICTED: B3 domain-containing protein REM16-like [Tarenaya hassleriana]